MRIWKRLIGIEGKRSSLSLTCEETYDQRDSELLTCGNPATKQVYDNRANKTYAMCAMCADHNTRNRSLKYLHEAIKDLNKDQIKEMISFLQGTDAGLAMLIEAFNQNRISDAKSIADSLAYRVDNKLLELRKSLC